MNNRSININKKIRYNRKKKTYESLFVNQLRDIITIKFINTNFNNFKREKFTWTKKIFVIFINL